MNIKMKFIFPIVLLIAAGAVAVFYDRNSNSPPAQRKTSEVLSKAASSPAQEKEVDPVSLPALMKKSWSGSNLSLLNVLSDNNSYTRYYIEYASGELTISGIMNVPKGTPPPGGFPVLILNHGHIDTAIYTNGRGLKREQDYFARNGFAVIHPDYRNHAQSDKDPNTDTNLRLGYAEDAINAIYAVKNSGLDYLSREKFGMLGHSMGGGVTEIVLTVQPDLLKAAVLYAPVSMDARDNYERWTVKNAETAEKITAVHGSPGENPEFWANISPVNFLNTISVPIQIHHGDSDTDVPLAWSTSAREALTKAGKEASLFIYPGQPHEFIPPSWTLFMERSTEFFKTHLQ